MSESARTNEQFALAGFNVSGLEADDWAQLLAERVEEQFVVSVCDNAQDITELINFFRATKQGPVPWEVKGVFETDRMPAIRGRLVGVFAKDDGEGWVAWFTPVVRSQERVTIFGEIDLGRLAAGGLDSLAIDFSHRRLSQAPRG